MLRIHTQTNAAAAKAYFDPAHHDYYVAGGDRPAEWGGTAGRPLGLEPGGPVDPAAFARLIDNLHPRTGERLTAAQRGFRRVGTDFTWSMPKSASVASLLDERIFPAFLESVRVGMAEVERDLAARVRVGGADADRVVGNGLWALFPHSTGRPVDGVPDVHRHVHAYLFNAVRDPVEGKWKAAQVGAVKQQAGYYEALVMNDFAGRLRGFGYGIRRKGRFFELEGVSDAVVRKFSGRTQRIEETARARGITDPRRKAELGGKTRERKARGLTFAQLTDLWLGRLTAEEREQLAARPGQVRPLPTAAEAVRYAIDHGFYFEAVRPAKRIVEAALRHGVGGVTPAELAAAAAQAGLIDRGGRATTRRLLGLDEDILGWAGAGRGACRPLYAFRDESRLPGSGPSGDLTAGQRALVRHIGASRDRVTLVRGAAGTGKTTALGLAADGIRRSGLPFRALALSHTAADELAAGVDPHARTLAAFLASRPAREAVRGGVVLLDEASQVGLEDFARLVRTLAAVDARLVAVGDDRQHAAVAGGAPYRLLIERAGLPVATLDEIVRQQDPLYRAACARFSGHDVAGGFRLLDAMGCVREADDPYRTEALVIDYLEAVRDRKSVLVVAPTHAEADAVTAGIRAALRREGVLAGGEREFPRLVGLNWTPAELAEARRDPSSPQAQAARDRGLVLTRYGAYRPDRIALAVGDSIRTTAGLTDARGTRVNNNSRFTVTGFTRGGIAVTSPTGVERVLPAAAGHLAHAYCQTSYASQSRTVDVVLVAESSRSFAAADRAQFYVSASRGRHAIKVYTDDRAALLEAVDRDRPKANAHDLLARPAEVAVESPLRRRALYLRRVHAAAARPTEAVRQTARERGVGYGR